MILINLLPYREEARKKLREGFYASLGFAVVVGLVLSGLIWLGLDFLYSSQDGRNTYLRQEIEVLGGQIAQISKLREEIDALRARQTAVENLQSDRNLAVHWLEELARQTPEGLFLTKVVQDGLNLTIEGITLSNDRVSEFLAKTTTGKSSWVTNSRWTGSIQAVSMSIMPNEPPRRVYTFVLEFDLVREDSSDPVSGDSVQN